MWEHSHGHYTENAVDRPDQRSIQIDGAWLNLAARGIMC